jgi:hypothetical protein
MPVWYDTGSSIQGQTRVVLRLAAGRLSSSTTPPPAQDTSDSRVLLVRPSLSLPLFSVPGAEPIVPGSSGDDEDRELRRRRSVQGKPTNLADIQLGESTRGTSEAATGAWVSNLLGIPSCKGVADASCLVICVA